MRRLLLILLAVAVAAPAAAQDHSQHSAHVGKEGRVIRALADAEVADLLAMQARAQELGERIVVEERQLDGLFAARTRDTARLRAQTTSIAALRGELRFVHLQAHIETTALLSERQIHHYDMVRGYRQHGGH